MNMYKKKMEEDTQEKMMSKKMMKQKMGKQNRLRTEINA